MRGWLFSNGNRLQRGCMTITFPGRWLGPGFAIGRGIGFVMKAELYGFRNGHGPWQWKMTLDYETDREMILATLEACTGVIRFRPEISLGQAAYLLDKLQRDCSGLVHPTDIWREFIIGCREAGMSQNLLARIKMIRSSIPIKASTSSRAPLNIRVLDHSIRILAGRSLLPEELSSLMADAGLGEWQANWKRYIQAGVCLGALRLEAGMEWTGRKSWTGTIRHVVKCRRCGTKGTRDIGTEFLFVREITRRVQSHLRGEGNGPARIRAAPASPEPDSSSEQHTVNWSVCKDCGGLCAYCEECLTMGRIRQCSVLIRGELAWLKREHESTGASRQEGTASYAESDWQHWGLSPAQKAAAEAGVDFLQATATRSAELSADKHILKQDAPARKTSLPRFLIWAVTGAGKTEMIFPLIEHELAHNRQVLIATPRKDVVLELAPRLMKAFPERSVVSLYGGSEERWGRGQVTLATTHQLMRFYHAFDLVIIDELDAYPYHNNPMLIHAAEEVCKPEGRYVLLSATPPGPMQKEAEQGTLPCVRVPVRYHRHPLPVPKRLVISPIGQMLKQGRIPRRLYEALSGSLNRGAQVFVFVPRIAWVEPLVQLLSRVFPDVSVKGTSSKDGLRRETVQGFRDRAFALLVTTTILERGVTVPKSDVFILGADAALFDEASLVQMAGRAGRSKDDPKGRVFFASREWTASQLRAIAQIRDMNRLASKKGYLLEEGKPDHGLE